MKEILGLSASAAHWSYCSASGYLLLYALPMANDREQYPKALQKWDQLHIDGAFSMPAELGSLAIMLAYDHKRDENPLHTDTFVDFESEAYALADEAQLRSKKADVAINATRADFREAMQNPSVTDIIVIGNGCLSAVNVPAPEKRVGWQHVGHMADHLKTGLFVQRFCGILPRRLNVPMGLMAVSSHSQVYAPVNRSIEPKSIHHPRNRLIQPVTAEKRLTYEAILADFPQSRLPLRDSIPLKARHLGRRVIKLEFRRFE
jgi:hypothetical protein